MVSLVPVKETIGLGGVMACCSGVCVLGAIVTLGLVDEEKADLDSLDEQIGSVEYRSVERKRRGSNAEPMTSVTVGGGPFTTTQVVV